MKSRTFSNPNPCQRRKGEGVFLIPASMQCQVEVRNVTRSKTDFSPALTMSSHTCNLLSHRGITYEHPRDTAPSLSTVGACCACKEYGSLSLERFSCGQLFGASLEAMFSSRKSELCGQTLSNQETAQHGFWRKNGSKQVTAKHEWAVFQNPNYLTSDFTFQSQDLFILKNY